MICRIFQKPRRDNWLLWQSSLCHFLQPFWYFPKAPLPNSYVSQATTIPGNVKYSTSLLIQDQPILRALLERHGSNRRQRLKPERETSVSHRRCVWGMISTLRSPLRCPIRNWGRDHLKINTSHLLQLDLLTLIPFGTIDTKSKQKQSNSCQLLVYHYSLKMKVWVSA